MLVEQGLGALAHQTEHVDLFEVVGQPMPARWTIERYVAAGGSVMSIGSDAHHSDHIGAGFEEAAVMLRRAGIEAEAVFTERERSFIPLAGQLSCNRSTSAPDWNSSSTTA